MVTAVAGMHRCSRMSGCAFERVIGVQVRAFIGRVHGDVRGGFRAVSGDARSEFEVVRETVEEKGFEH